jgi:hypothetical protein
MTTGDATEGQVCPDVELLAAFIERSLPPGEARQVEGHVSNCARCAQVLAVSLSAEPAPETGFLPGAPFWRSWRWAVPVVTAATVAGLWVATTGPQIERAGTPAVERPETPSMTAPQEPVVAPLPGPVGSQQAAARAAGASSAQAAQQESRVAPPKASDDSVRDQALRQEDVTRAERSAPARESNAAAPPAADADSPSTPATEAGAARQVEAPILDSVAAAAIPATIVPSPSPDVLWRARDAVVERSIDAGATWQAEYTADRPVLGGSAVSRDVAWFHGAGALILRRTPAGWSEVPPPESGVEIASVRSLSADTATVTLVDGRQFRTDNRGQTWTAP